MGRMRVPQPVENDSAQPRLLAKGDKATADLLGRDGRAVLTAENEVEAVVRRTPGQAFCCLRRAVHPQRGSRAGV